MAAAVMGLVMDAIQTMVSVCMGRLAAMSAKPTALRCRILSGVASNVTAPAASFLAITSCMAAVMAGISGAFAAGPAESAAKTGGVKLAATMAREPQTEKNFRMKDDCISMLQNVVGQ